MVAFCGTPEVVIYGLEQAVKLKLDHYGTHIGVEIGTRLLIVVLVEFKETRGIESCDQLVDITAADLAGGFADHLCVFDPVKGHISGIIKANLVNWARAVALTAFHRKHEVV